MHKQCNSTITLMQFDTIGVSPTNLLKVRGLFHEHCVPKTGKLSRSYHPWDVFDIFFPMEFCMLNLNYFTTLVMETMFSLEKQAETMKSLVKQVSKSKRLKELPDGVGRVMKERGSKISYKRYIAILEALALLKKPSETRTWLSEHFVCLSDTMMPLENPFVLAKVPEKVNSSTSAVLFQAVRYNTIVPLCRQLFEALYNKVTPDGVLKNVHPTTVYRNITRGIAATLTDSAFNCPNGLSQLFHEQYKL